MALHPQLFRVQTIGLMWGQQCMNVLYLKGKTAAIKQDQIATAAINYWIESSRRFQGASFHWTEVWVKDLGFPNADVYKATVVGKDGKWADGTQTFGFISQVITLRTGTSSRSTRGRLYIPGSWPGLWSGGLSNGNYTGAYNEFQPIFENNLLAGGSSNTIATICVYSKKLDSYMECSSWGARVIPAIQRRRNIGVGM